VFKSYVLCYCFYTGSKVSHYRQHAVGVVLLFHQHQRHWVPYSLLSSSVMCSAAEEI
jgi:hypothetical protein